MEKFGFFPSLVLMKRVLSILLESEVSMLILKEMLLLKIRPRKNLCLKIVLTKSFSIGSTMQLLKYTTTGDAGDWLLGRHGIITMTPEVGKMDTVSGRQYFPRRHFIMPAIQ